MANSSSVIVGSILENRYRIVRELGCGGFGRTYLAEDIQQHKERLAIKGFDPQVKNKEELRKAKELFAREAGMLSSLEHPQIPRCRELLWVEINGKDTLFIVQDYIEGQTYWQLLESKGRLNEVEVTQLLQQILPVLEYIHGKNIIHRDISPDNIILRNSDKLPVLIDFGSVKQITANAISQFTGLPGTVIGKPGYSPEEQMRQGKASVAGDLYALAATVVVLLTGKDPRDLYDIHNAKWIWDKQVKVSPNLSKVLNKMLAHRMIDRYQSAKDVLLALPKPAASQITNNPCQIGTVASPAQPANQAANPPKNNNNLSQIGTVVVAPNQNSPKQPANNPPPPAPNVPKGGTFLSRIATIVAAPRQKLRQKVNSFIAKREEANRKELKVIAIAVGAGLLLVIGSVAVAKVVKSVFKPPSFPIGISGNKPDISLPKAEVTRIEKILQRRDALKINPVEFNKKVDELFHQQHPELKGRVLTNKSEDDALRDDWSEIAEKLLAKLEKGQR